ASSSLSVTIDTTAAAPSAPDLVAASDSAGPNGSSTDNITNDATPTMSSKDAETPATYTLYVTNGTSVLGTTTADGSGNWTITSSSLGDGVHTLTAHPFPTRRSSDLASSSLSVTIDTTAAAPSAPDLVAASDSAGPNGSSTDNITNDATP